MLQTRMSLVWPPATNGSLRLSDSFTKSGFRSCTRIRPHFFLMFIRRPIALSITVGMRALWQVRSRARIFVLWRGGALVDIHPFIAGPLPEGNGNWVGPFVSKDAAAGMGKVFDTSFEPPPHPHTFSNN